MSERCIDITIKQGATFNMAFYWYFGDPVTKPISAVTLGYPPTITATAHGLPTAKIPAQIAAVGGSEDLNTLGDDTVYALKLSTDTFSLPDVDAADFDPYTSGGYLVYTAPRDLTGFSARMQIRSSVTSPTVILELNTTSGGIVLGGTEGTVTLTIAATASAALAFTSGVYQLELTDGSGVVTRLVSGNVYLDPEVVR